MAKEDPERWKKKDWGNLDSIPLARIFSLLPGWNNVWSVELVCRRWREVSRTKGTGGEWLRMQCATPHNIISNNNDIKHDRNNTPLTMCLQDVPHLQDRDFPLPPSEDCQSTEDSETAEMYGLFLSRVGSKLTNIALGGILPHPLNHCEPIHDQKLTVGRVFIDLLMDYCPLIKELYLTNLKLSQGFLNRLSASHDQESSVSPTRTANQNREPSTNALSRLRHICLHTISQDRITNSLDSALDYIRLPKHLDSLCMSDCHVISEIVGETLYEGNQHLSTVYLYLEQKLPSSTTPPDTSWRFPHKHKGDEFHDNDEEQSFCSQFGNVKRVLGQAEQSRVNICVDNQGVGAGELVRMFRTSPSITHLHLHVYTANLRHSDKIRFFDELRHLRNLQSLRLSGSAVMINCGALRAICCLIGETKLLPFLKELHIHNCARRVHKSAWDDSVRWLNILEAFSLHGCDTFASVHLTRLIKNNPKLRFLELKYCYGLKSDDLRSALESLPLLESYIVANCEKKLHVAPICQLLVDPALTPSLVYVKIYPFIMKVNDYWLQALKERFKSVKRIRSDKNEMYTHNGYAAEKGIEANTLEGENRSLHPMNRCIKCDGYVFDS